MTIRELYEYARECNCEDLSLYVVTRDSEGEIEWAESVEEYKLEFYDEDAVVEC